MKVQYQSWMRDGPKVFTPGGNRARPSYDAIVTWVSNCHKDLQEDIIRRSFSACGLYHRGFGFKDLEFIANLNARIRKHLFLDGHDYDRDMKAIYIMTTPFSSLNALNNEIEDYISSYYERYKQAVKERKAQSEESDQIYFEEESNPTPHASASHVSQASAPQASVDIFEIVDYSDKLVTRSEKPFRNWLV